MKFLTLGVWGVCFGLCFAQEITVTKQELSSFSRGFWIQDTAKSLPIESWTEDLRYRASVKATWGDSWTVFLGPQLQMYQHPTLTDLQAHFQEAYVSWSPGSGVYVDVGKKAMKWGSAYAWNVVNQLIQPDNPFVVQNPSYDNMVQGQYFVDAGQSITAIQWLGQAKSALRYHRVMGGLDLNISLLHPSVDQTEFGLDSSVSLGESSIGYLELLNQPQGTDVVVGIQHTDEEAVNVIAEYFYNAKGHTPAQVDALRRSGQLLQAGVPFAEFRQQYGFFRLAKDGFGPVNLALENFYSIQEGSFLVIPSGTWPISEGWETKLEWFCPVGPGGNEFATYFTTYFRVQSVWSW